MITRRPAFDVGPIHFVGIGGIGMSGIAEILLNLGYCVQGSDLRNSANIERLRRLGAKINIGHDGNNVASAGVIVVSSAIKADNVELKAARNRAIPVVRRADMLAELIRLKWTVAVAGTHGKTTTTSMIAALLDGTGKDPTVVNGGVINAYGSNAKLGHGNWMVVEADESDGSFTRLRATVAVITNIDAEHMDHYGNMDELRAGFAQFLENLPFYGFAILCADDPEALALSAQIEKRRLITYGLSPKADIRAVNIVNAGGNIDFELILREPRRTNGEKIQQWSKLTLPMAGRHNLQNALAAIAVARELGGSEEQIRTALAGFGGVKRRFTTVGEFRGIRIIDDYGHHPTEITAVLQSARDMQKTGQVIAVIQPHRYSRLSNLFDDFCACGALADHLLVVPVYPAGEKPLKGVDNEALVRGVRQHGHRSAIAVPSLEMLPEIVYGLAREGDLVICLGAGDISVHAGMLADKMAEL